MSDTIHIIACSVFKPALCHLEDLIAECPFSLTYLPSNLHLRPNELKERLLTAVQQVCSVGRRVVCFYGCCFPGIDRCLEPAGVVRIPCGQCYELFLGHRQFNRIITTRPGTFFTEKELLLDFDNLCRGPLELDDPDMREMFFQHYQQVVYIRQPLDPPLADRARWVADFLGLELNIVDADYSELKQYVRSLCVC